MPVFPAVIPMGLSALVAGLGALPGRPDAVTARPAAAYNLAAPPEASFTWSPLRPRVNQQVLFASTSVDRTSRITAYEWDFSGFGAFQPGASTESHVFTTPGDHEVLLRVRSADGQSAVARGIVHMVQPPPGVLTPFPIIRIAGNVVRRGVRLKLMTVRAPRGSTIRVQCRPAGRCHIHSVRRADRRGLERFHSFERRLIPAGVRLLVRVSKPGLIGAYTSFVIRRHRIPLRRDRCLDLAGAKPMACPGS